MSALPKKHIWRKRVPPWIPECEVFQRKTSKGRNPSKVTRDVVEAIADRGTLVQTGPFQGSIIDCWGGKPLIEAVGCASSTFWTAIAWLIDHRYVFMLARGGLRLCDRQREISSTYGIPGQRGAFDDLEQLIDGFTVVRREMCRFITDNNGKRRKVVTQPGSQASLFGDDLMSQFHGCQAPSSVPHDSDSPHASPHSQNATTGQGVSADRTGGARPPDRVCPPTGHPPHAVSCPVHSSGMDKDHGHGGIQARTGGARGTGVPYFVVRPQVFSNYNAMVELYKVCVTHRLAENTQNGWDKFAALVCRCKRLGTKNPAGMLGTNLREQRWDRLTKRDFDDVAQIRRDEMGRIL